MGGMMRRRAIMKQAAPEPSIKWSYSYANGDMVKYTGNYANAAQVNNRMMILTSTNRWSFCLTSGDYQPLRTANNGNLSPWDRFTVIVPNVFPIPIPRTATAVTTTATFRSGTGQVQTDCAVVDSDGEYPRALQTGWKANPCRLTFTAGQYDYIFPKVSADVTELTVVFEE